MRLVHPFSDRELRDGIIGWEIRWINKTCFWNIQSGLQRIVGTIAVIETRGSGGVSVKDERWGCY